jgi:hypothetical protein
VLRHGASQEELMEAIWVAAEMRAGGAYAHSVLAIGNGKSCVGDECVRRRHDCVESQADFSSPTNTSKFMWHWVELRSPSEADAAEIPMPAALLPANQSSVIRLHWLTFKDASVKQFFRILAVTPGKVLRTKPQNLLVRLPIQNEEAVA